MKGYRRVQWGGLAVASAAALAGCGAIGGGGDIAGKSIRYQVEYYGSPEDVQSHRALTIAYATTDGRQEQADVDLPWTRAIGTVGAGFTASVTAQFDGFGTISCRIVADGKVIVQKSSAQEPYATVDCSA